MGDGAAVAKGTSFSEAVERICFQRLACEHAPDVAADGGAGILRVVGERGAGAAVGMGNGGAVAYLLRSRGGTAFVTEAVATKLQQEGVARLVTDAPRISHPIYSAVHIRHHHSHTHVRLLKALKLMTA